MTESATHTGSGIKLVVGLGNPGSQYAATRHNVGAWFADSLAKQHAISLSNQTKFQGAAEKFQQDGRVCHVFIPNTYMNESGRAVAAIMRFYKIEPSSMLVAHDELDFDAGVIRLKEGGGHGGHNGLRDIIASIGTKDFYRLRIGIGHPGNKSQVTSYVLKPPAKQEQQLILTSIDEGLSAMKELMQGDYQRAFTWLHSE
ncbi:MAG: aminoacyl-tRNA hydrolase [Gammaproteobacteria bacterium]|nr:aminoacyl-tRNA hydrolase [Gammaproteobacteria bacterium]MCH9744586.1 aminoacyl-tRNA hydrolase [Gammaproteobacteria bacterium]